MDGERDRQVQFAPRLLDERARGPCHLDGLVHPPRRLAYTFINVSDTYKGEVPALATFVLEPYGRLVKLTLTHEGFSEDSKFLNGISKGWPAILSSLKSILETGQPLEIPYAALKFES